MKAARKEAVLDDRHLGHDRAKVEKALRASLAQFPARLLEELVSLGPGRLEVVAVPLETTASIVGAYDRRTGVARFDVDELRLGRGVVEEEVTHLLDHWLGSRGEGMNLSEGAASRESLQTVADELRRLYRRRQATGEFLTVPAGRNPREFLAQGVRDYLKRSTR